MGRAALAAIFGVTPRRVTEWRADGMPFVSGGGRGVEATFDVEACKAWRAKRSAADGNTNSLAQARTSLAEAQRRKTELEIRSREGDLLDRGEVRRVWAQRVTSLRARLVMLAPTAVQRGIVPPANEPALQELVDEAMREIAGETG